MPTAVKIAFEASSDAVCPYDICDLLKIGDYVILGRRIEQVSTHKSEGDCYRKLEGFIASSTYWGIYFSRNSGNGIAELILDVDNESICKDTFKYSSLQEFSKSYNTIFYSYSSNCSKNAKIEVEECLYFKVENKTLYYYIIICDNISDIKKIVFRGVIRLNDSVSSPYFFFGPVARKHQYGISNLYLDKAIKKSRSGFGFSKAPTKIKLLKVFIGEQNKIISEEREV